MPAGFRLADLVYDAGQSQTDADGEAIVSFGPVPNGFVWKVQRIVSRLNVGVFASQNVYVGEPNPLNLVASPSEDDYSQELLVPGGQELHVVFAGAGADGARLGPFLVTVRIQYELHEILYDPMPT